MTLFLLKLKLWWRNVWASLTRSRITALNDSDERVLTETEQKIMNTPISSLPLGPKIEEKTPS